MRAVQACLVFVCAALAAPEVVPAEQGDTVVLHCPGADGDDTADYWLEPGGTKVPVPFSEGNFVSNATSLVILKVEETHAGEYRCHRPAGEGGATGTVRLAVRSSKLLYWQDHATNFGLAVLASAVFLLGCAGVYLVNHCRYEKRHKTGSARNGDGLSRAHSNPALEVEAETHM